MIKICCKQLIMKYLIYIFFLTSLLSCGGTTSNNQSAENQLDANPGRANTAAAAAVAYPALPQKTLDKLLNSCDYIDYIFYTANFSMNQSNAAAIQATLKGISSEGATVAPTCEAVGHVFFQVEGEVIAEADLFLEDDCTLYRFTENQRPVYANQITPQGISYYVNVFRQLEGNQ